MLTIKIDNSIAQPLNQICKKLACWSNFNGFLYIMSSYKEVGLRCPSLLCHEIVLEMSSDVMDLSCTASNMSQNNLMLLWSILPQWPAVLKG